MAGLLYLVSSVVFFIFALATLFFVRYHPVKTSFVAALLMTSLWAGTSAFGPTLLWHYLELTRDLSWLWLLIHLLNPTLKWSYFESTFRRGVLFFSVLFFALLAVDIYFSLYLTSTSRSTLFSLWSYEYLLLSIAGLILVEQLLRNADAELLWAIKLLSIVIAVQFVYDMVLYSSSLLSVDINPHLWRARPVFILLLIPLMWISMQRITNRKSKVVISHHIAFHGISLIGVGGYLLLMSAIGYYIQLSNREWGPLVQIIFLCVALLVLVVVVFSGQVRAQVKVYISKHFFDYKYDYRDEWLRFSDSFSVLKSDTSLEERIILSIANIIDSTGGSIWVKDGREYINSACLNHAPLPKLSDRNEGNLVAFLEESGWVVDVREYQQNSERYEWLMLPGWLQHDSNIRLLVPIVHQGKPLAILGLNQPLADREFNWEDRDLLKTVAQQSAGYLTLMNLSKELHDAKQFEAFNRLSAYVVHDLKNVVSQLSLVVKNAEKHKNNPEFIESALLTVDNAAKKMNRMLQQLRKDRSMIDSSSSDYVDLVACLTAACDARRESKPLPVLVNESDDRPYILADEERLEVVLVHLLQNAQEATPESGKVEIVLQIEHDQAIISVRDSGCGMTKTFIRNRLFKPFDTTKGNAGMGIGVYEAREYIQNIGGRLTVASTVGQGTVFSFAVPVVKNKQP